MGWLCGCQTIALKGNPSVDLLAKIPEAPHSLAILPTLDLTGRPGLRPLVREALYEALSALPYRDRELARVDGFLSALAAQLNCTPDQLPPEALAHPQLADCVVFSKVTDVGRFFFLLYSHIYVELDFVMADTRTRQIVYRNRFRILNRRFSLMRE